MARQLADRGHHVFAAVRNPSRAADPSDVEKIEVVTLGLTSLITRIRQQLGG